MTFDQVGGMEHHVRALKEMIFLPLVYPELFERFHISPPRGVLFYGPPGDPLLADEEYVCHQCKEIRKRTFIRWSAVPCAFASPQV